MSVSPDQLQSDRRQRIADWTEPSPRAAIERDGEIYELPQPVTSLTCDDSWDSERFKTLLVDGDTTVGSTRNGIDIAVTGEIGQQAGDVILTDAELFAALSELRDQLHVSPDGPKFRFYLHRDIESESFRFVEGCTAMKLETDMSQRQTMTYRLVIHADDPTIYAELGE